MTQTIDILDRLIAFETVSAQSNLSLIDYVQDFLAQRGFAVTRIPDPDKHKAGLYAEIGPAGGGVILSGHSDVVPTKGQSWTKDPFKLTRADNRLYGRGTTDMKGFVAAMLNAADIASKTRLREPLKLVLSYDEEVGCIGIDRMMGDLRTLIGVPRMAIVGEPTDMQVAIGHKGKRAYHASITGEAGHSAMAPRFVNALDVAADMVQGLRALQDDIRANGATDPDYDIPYSTLHVGTLAGGRALNIVPDSAEMAFEFRHIAQDDPDVLEQRVRDVAKKVLAGFGTAASISLDRLINYPGLSTAPDDPVVARMIGLTGQKTTKVGFGTEAGFFVALGIPTIVCGPGSMEGQGHKADEYIEEADLMACDDMLGQLLDSMTE